MEYEIREFTRARLAEVAEEWLAIAGSDEFESELGGLFEWCETHWQPSEGDAQAFDVYNASQGRTDAIVELVDGRRGRLTKLLKIWPSPAFWNADIDPEVRTGVIRLFSGAYMAVVLRGYVEGTEKLKIYGRTQLMHEILVVVESNWNTATGWRASMEGRWLALSRI